jgi:hypothetical protein
MKILQEIQSGFRTINGNTISATFQKDSDQYKELIEEGCRVELIPQAEKDAHEDQLRKQEVIDKITDLESTITPRRLRDALKGDISFLEETEAKIEVLRGDLK